MNHTLFRTSKILLLLSLFSLTACISHQQYRLDYGLCTSAQPDKDCPSSALQEYRNPASPDSDYLMSFIELDDQGQLWDRQQMWTVINKLASDSADSELLMVVFVHGWKHSAMSGDENIQTFRNSLERLSLMESVISRQLGREPRKVAGIYLGWRGGSISVPVVKELTFWDRKKTAHKVGFGGATELLSRLEQIQKAKRAQSSGDHDDSLTRLVIVGHSFGGAVIYSALSELLENGLVQTGDSDGQVGNARGVADLVVLINPAFEALEFANLSDMANERRTYFPGQLPRLAILTSEADYATRYAFPVGRWLSTFFEKDRHVQRQNPVSGAGETIDQGDANITAVGHFDGYKTHYLKAEDSTVAPDDFVFDPDSEMALFTEVGNGWESDHPGSSIRFNGSILERTMNSVGRNPYLNIRVDKKLIHDHNDINDPRIESFLRQLILLSIQSPEVEGREQLRTRMLSK